MFHCVGLTAPVKVLIVLASVVFDILLVVLIWYVYQIDNGGECSSK